jgi:hypothetical protein
MVVSFFRFWLEFVLVVVFVFVIEDYVGGDKVGEVVKLDSSDGDLFTAWILRMFYSLFASVGTGGIVAFSVLDETGSPRTFYMKRNMGTGIAHMFNTYNCASGVRVRYGSSSEPPRRDDRSLWSEVYVDGSPRLVIDEGRGLVMVESVVSFGSDTTICEVGLSLYATVSGVSTCGEFLLDRTVLSPCRVIPANTPYTVRYRVQL